MATKTENTAKAERAAPIPEDAKIVVTDKDFEFGREGTFRHQCWSLARKGTKVSTYLRNGGARKYLPRFVKAGAITVSA